jgi:hypothetical protein
VVMKWRAAGGMARVAGASWSVMAARAAEAA